MSDFKNKRKGKKKYVAQQRVYLIKKEFLKFFCQTNGCFQSYQLLSTSAAGLLSSVAFHKVQGVQ